MGTRVQGHCSLWTLAAPALGRVIHEASAPGPERAQIPEGAGHLQQSPEGPGTQRMPEGSEGHLGTPSLQTALLITLHLWAWLCLLQGEQQGGR